LADHYRKGKTMLCGTVEPGCRQRKRVILAGIVDAVDGAVATTAMPAAIRIPADDAPDRQATKDVARATIHPAVDGVATAGCKLLGAARHTSARAYGATDWANSTAVN
jgi:hypothetical protein